MGDGELQNALDSAPAAVSSALSRNEPSLA
jgi:hypothetical protein